MKKHVKLKIQTWKLALMIIGWTSFIIINAILFALDVFSLLTPLANQITPYLLIVYMLFAMIIYLPIYVIFLKNGLAAVIQLKKTFDNIRDNRRSIHNNGCNPIRDNAHVDENPDKKHELGMGET